MLEEAQQLSALGPDPIETPGGNKLPKPHFVPTNLKGRPAYNMEVLDQFRGLPLTKQGDVLRRQWSSIAKILADKIERAAPHLTKGDWYYFKSLIISGGVALDKAFPVIDTPLANNLIVNMFGSLGPDSASKVLGVASLPTIDVTPIEIKETSQPPTVSPSQKEALP